MVDSASDLKVSDLTSHEVADAANATPADAADPADADPNAADEIAALEAELENAYAECDISHEHPEPIVISLPCLTACARMATVASIPVARATSALRRWRRHGAEGVAQQLGGPPDQLKAARSFGDAIEGVLGAIDLAPPVLLESSDNGHQRYTLWRL